MKLNDWILAGLSNPELSTSDFILQGLNLSNTLLLPSSEYKKSSYIKDRFSNNGVFNENAFDLFYKKRVTEFGRLLSIDTKDTLLFDPFDTRATRDSLIKSPNFKLEQVANLGRDTITLTGDIYKGSMSQRELAQLNKIYNYETGEWSEDTLSDRSLFKSPIKWFKTLFDEPLVYATYDEDGDHYDLFTGQRVKHKKGEYKLNLYGTPYTETLGNRSIIGKEAVAATDILTVDGSKVNEYDFFDSDDIEKSIGGTIMKTAVSVAPLLMGPYIAGIYSGILVTREIAKSLPMLYGIATSLSDSSLENTLLNKLAAKGLMFTSSTSDYGRSSILNVEVLGTLLSDVVLLYGLLQIIAKGIRQLRGGNELMKEAYNKAGAYYAMQKLHLEDLASKGIITKAALEKYLGDPKKWQESAIGKAAIKKFTKEIEPIIKSSNRLGADASLAYMALVSNTDVYSSMLEAGASKKEAAAVALGSTIGMFGVDRYAHLGELFFDDLTADYERLLRRTFTKEAKSWYNNVIKLNASEPKTSNINKFRKLFKSGIDFGKKQTNKYILDLKYHSTGFFGKALGEGLEEVSEELVADMSKQMYETLGDLGFNTTVRDVGAWDNAAARYGMSFLGGTLGGGLFYGINTVLNGNYHIDLTLDELIYLVRNGKTNEALKTLDDWRKKGKLGSTSLSTNITKDENNNDVFVTAEKTEDSLNEFIYNRIKETILSLDNIINENDAKLSESELFENMILSEARFKDLLKYLDLLNFSYTTGYLRDFLNIISNIANLETSLSKASKSLTGLPSDPAASDELLRNITEADLNRRSNNIKKILDQLKEAKDELSKFLSGEYSLEYTEKMLFALDPHLNEDFIAMTYDLWLKKNHNGKTINDLSPSEALQYKLDYLNYKKSALSKDLTEKFNIYKSIKEKLNPVLLQILENQENFKKFLEEISKLKEEGSPLFIKQYKYDDILDFAGETKESEEYINRNNPENIDNRTKLINEENLRLLLLSKDKILEIINNAGGFIDPITRRDIKLTLNLRNKDILNIILEDFKILLAENNSEIDLNTNTIIKKGSLSSLDESILQVLSKIDINNPSFKQIRQLIKDNYKSEKVSLNRLLNNILAYLTNSPFSFGVINPEYLNLYGSDLKSIIESKIGEGLTIDELFDISNSKIWHNDLGELSLALFAVFATKVKEMYNDGTLDSFIWMYNNLNDIVDDEELLNNLRYYREVFDNYINSINTNPIILLNNELDAKVSDINPVTDLIKSLALSLNIDMNNLEKIMNALNQRYDDIHSIDDLILSSTEKESFEEATYLIKLAKSYLYATSSTPNILSPFGHNSTLNEFAENHKDIYKDVEKLPILSTDVAAMYELELNKYLMLMGIMDEKTGKYNPGSWLWLSSLNEINKSRLFIKADKAWSKVCYDIFNNNLEAFKFSYNGKDYNLLEGFETIPLIIESTLDSLVHLNKLFNLFYNNILKVLSDGITYDLIWKLSGILDKITNLSEVIEQKTCLLDENVSYDKLTSYDKLIFLATIGAIDSTKFYSYLHSRVSEENNIVPLTIQEWVSRVGIALTENPDIFNSILQYVGEKTNSKKPILLNTVYITGGAGTGKTRVAARNIAKNIKGNNIWLSTPKESQINTLFESVDKGIKFLNRDELPNNSGSTPSLMSSIGVDEKAYKEAMDSLKNPNDKNNPYFIKVDVGETTILNLDFSKFGIKKIDNAPDAIIIDEATHLSNLELQLLSEFCRVNNSRLILIGDDTLSGFNQIGRNIDRELCIVVRTPELGISLRDNNILHQYNLNLVRSLIRELQNLDFSDPDYATKVNTIKSLLKNIRFKVYNLNDINGELFLNSLTPEFIDKMKGNVGYIGRKGSTLDALLSSNLDVTVLSETEVLGLEFDYAVIDKNFKIPTKNSKDVELLEFLLDLYTMISRGRKGTIIIDPSNSLLNIIGTNRVELAKAGAPSISEYTLEFRNEKLELLNKVLSGLSNTLLQTPSVQLSTSNLQNIPLLENWEDKIILDKDFNFDDLDFDNNTYVLSLISYLDSEKVAKEGLYTPNGLELQGILVTSKGIIESVILALKEGHGYNGSDSIILLKFPKSDFNITKDLNEINRLLEGSNTLSKLIPPQYIENIIRVIPDSSPSDIRTDESEIVSPPESIEDEIESISNEITELEDLPNSPMLGYGNATFIGMKVEKRDELNVWINPLDEIKKDGQLFTDKQEISSKLEQIDLSNKILALKLSFLYRENYNDLPNFITNIISEDSYNNIEWYIEARPKTEQDNFIRNIALSRDGMEISSKNLVFSVIGEFKLKDGKTGKITLGLMSDPANWINRVPSIIEKIDKKIEKLKDKLNGKVIISLDERERITKKIKQKEEYKSKLDLTNNQSDPLLYKAYIEKIAAKYDGTNPVRIKIPSIITPGLTDIHNGTSIVRLSRLSKVLIKSTNNRIALLKDNLKKVRGDVLIRSKITNEIAKAELKLKEFEEIKDHSFRSLNPYTTVSPMYIYTPARKGKYDIDDSVIGKYNVVFVTNKKGLSPDDLVNIYIRLKNLESISRENTEENNTEVPAVRMLVLNNLGVSFLDMSNPYLQDIMLSKVLYTDKNGKTINRSLIFPFKTNFMGIRMYVGLWNFRANLLLFQKQLIKFTNNLPIDVTKLDIYLIYKDLKWRSENERKLNLDEKDFLSRYSNLEKFEEVSKLIDDFNNSLGDKVKLFRLGSDMYNGAYIRYLTGDISSLYTKTDKISGIYINYSTANKYLALIESIFTNVLDHVVACDYNKDRLLSTKEGIKNSFANHLTSLANKDGLITIRDVYSDDEGNFNLLSSHTILFGSSFDPTGSKGILNTFSHIPAILMKVFKYTNMRQKHLLGDTFDTEDQFSIKITGTVEDKDGKEIQLDKEIPYYRIWDNIRMIEALDEYDYDAIDNYVFDDSLSNLFSFAFHGTLEDISKNGLRASDALFPHGFFADPLSTTDIIYDGSNKAFTKSVQLLIFFGTKARVGLPTFFISLLTLKDSVDFVPEVKPVSNVDQEINNIIDNVIKNYSELENKLESIRLNSKSLEEDKRKTYVRTSILNELLRLTNNNITTIFSGILPHISPNIIVDFDSDFTPNTLGEIIRSNYILKYNELLPSIVSISLDGKSLIVDADTVTVKVSRGLNGSISVTRIGAEQVLDSDFIQKINEITKILEDIGYLDLSSLLEDISTYSSVLDDLKPTLSDIILNRITDICKKLKGSNGRTVHLIRKILKSIKQPYC